MVHITNDILPYTLPCDGYLQVNSGSTSTSASVTDSLGTLLFDEITKQALSHVFLKKGMKITTLSVDTGGSVYFIKIK